MEPYITYRDYYTAEIGNPDIRPEYIHSFELNYKKTMGEHTLQSSLFYRKRKDKIERLRVPYEAGVTLDSMANVGNDYSLGVELSTQLKVTKWWNLDVNGNIYYYKVMNNINSGGKKETSTNYDITSITFFGFIRIPVFSWTGISWGLRLLHKGGRILFGLSIWLFVSSCSVLICNRPSPFGIYSILPVTKVTLRQPIYNQSHGFNRNSL